MNYKKTNASKTTVSRDLYGLSKDIGNIYETEEKEAIDKLIKYSVYKGDVESSYRT